MLVPINVIRSLKIAAAVVILSSASTAAFGQVSDFALFGGQGLNLGQSAKVLGGATGSNGNIYVAAFNEVHGLYGGGSLLPPAGGGGTYYGPVVFNGSANIGTFAAVNGPVDVGGSLTINGSVAGNVTAGGSVYNGSFATVTGDIRAAGNVVQSGGTVTGNVAANGGVSVAGTINGNVTYNSFYTHSGFGNVTGSVTQASTTAVPQVFAARTLPAETSFTSGGANVIAPSSDVHLAPGSYGDLSIGALRDLYLTGGDYYFNSFNFDGSKIHLDGISAATPLHIFVTGDITTGAIKHQLINGLPFAQVVVDPTLANLITWETHGDFLESSLGDNEWLGTIFAPDGNITFGQYTDLVGRAYAGGTLTAGVGMNVNVQVPEPTLLGTLGLLAPLGRRRR